MAEIVVFTPKSELLAEENLQAFIALCQEQLTVFGADLNFEENIWDISDSIKLKGRGDKRSRVPFSTFETANASRVQFMDEPFLSFAKADFRYSFAMRPTKSPSRRVSALRALESALRETGSANNITKATAETFNRAAQLIKGHFSVAAAYRIGGQLEMLAKFLTENRLVVVPIDWRNPLKRPSDTSRVGKDFDERRNAKLPSEAALNALPRLFNMVTEPFDELLTSLAAILCSAPDRINEVLLLPVECEVRQKNRNGQDVYGLRWWPAKGAEPMVKWIVPSMAEVVASAIAKIRRITCSARSVALWYEKNPTKLYLPPDCEYLRSREFLNSTEIGMVLYEGRIDRNTALSWCKLNEVPLSKDGRRSIARFSDIERAVIGKLPRNFPYVSEEVGLKYSDALFVSRRNECHSVKSAFNCLVDAITIDQVNSALGGRVEHGVSTIFNKHGFQEADGSEIRVTTHQFRHYLNTLAQAGGMSQLDIAKWSGRKDVRQNAAYDHVSADELVLKIRNALGDDRQMFGPLAELPKRVVISRDEFAQLKVPTAHTTEFGVCIHDYTMAPCQLHADCLNCNEQVCIKGDEIRLARIRTELAEAVENLTAAEQAHSEGYFGASRWVAHHRLTVERLTQLCAILDDPKVPVGAVIQLSNLPVASRIEQAAEDRAALLEHKEQRAAPSEAAMSAMRNILVGMVS